MRHALLGVPLVLALGSVSAAQGDPDRPVKEGGVMVSGWMAEIDGNAVKSGMKLSDAKFVAMGSGLHVTSGPAAYYWNPSHVARGIYTVKASFSQRSAPTHPEAYGVFIGGSDLGTKDRNYLYCVVFATGMYSVKHQFGSENHTLANRKPSDAIRKADSLGQATNEIALKVTPEKVSCVINGVEVESFNKAAVLGPGKLESTDGVYGLRVNHNLDVHIAGFGLTKP